MNWLSSIDPMTFLCSDDFLHSQHGIQSIETILTIFNPQNITTDDQFNDDLEETNDEDQYSNSSFD